MGNLLLSMSLECHMIDCSDCGHCIIGKRLRCIVCTEFSLCEACTGRPMHWPGAPLPAHLAASPGHRFAQVVLPSLSCPQGHQVEPGDLQDAEAQSCESCMGPLHNGVLPVSQGPQFRCPECQFALCVGCYWANRRAIGDKEAEAESWVQTDETEARGDGVDDATQTSGMWQSHVGVHKDVEKLDTLPPPAALPDAGLP